MSIERRRVMAVMGAEIVLTEAAKGMPGAIAKAKEIADSNPTKYFMPGQFDNPRLLRPVDDLREQRHSRNLTAPYPMLPGPACALSR